MTYMPGWRADSGHASDLTFTHVEPGSIVIVLPSPQCLPLVCLCPYSSSGEAVEEREHLLGQRWAGQTRGGCGHVFPAVQTYRGWLVGWPAGLQALVRLWHEASKALAEVVELVKREAGTLV